MFAAAKRRIRDRRGQSLVETAVVLPILLLLFCGIVDFGWIMSNQLLAENGCREGARLGSVIADHSDCRARVEERVLHVMPEYAHEFVQVDTQLSGGDVHVTVTYTFKLLTPITQILFGKQEYTVTTDCIMKAE